MTGMRQTNPELWAEIANAAREIVGDWDDDQIAAVLSKVRAPDPDTLLERIGAVLAWCAAAQDSGNEEAEATVELWQMPGFPIRITVDADGSISHALDVERDGGE